MKSNRISKRKFINEIIKRIESRFKDTIVIWRGTGIPDEIYDDTEVFEALWVPLEDHELFRNFVWNLQESYAEPNGCTIMVDSLSPEITKEFRWREYQEGIARRKLVKAEAG